MLDSEKKERIVLSPKREAGSTLVESAVALAVLGIIAVVFLTGLATTSKVNFVNDESGTAASLAQLETESVKAAPYVFEASQYTLAPVPGDKDYLGYAVTMAVLPLHNPDDGIQKITVNVNRNGKQVFRLDSYKVNR